MEEKEQTDKQKLAKLNKKMEGIKTHIVALEKIKAESETMFRDYDKRRNSFVSYYKDKDLEGWEQGLFDLLIESTHLLESFLNSVDERHSKIKANLEGVKTQSEKDKEKLEQREKAPENFELGFNSANKLKE